MKIYLAGPMRGHEETYPKKFKTYTRELRGKGYVVFSPLEADEAREAEGIKTTIRNAMKDDLLWICGYADAVAFMPGWETSKGCKVEHTLAECLGLKFIYL